MEPVATGKQPAHPMTDLDPSRTLGLDAQASHAPNITTMPGYHLHRNNPRYSLRRISSHEVLNSANHESDLLLIVGRVVPMGSFVPQTKPGRDVLLIELAINSVGSQFCIEGVGLLMLTIGLVQNNLILCAEFA